MPTPPTLAAFAENAAGVASGAAVTTASVTWQAGDVVVLFAATEGGTGGETIGTPSTTGTGISFGAAQQIHESTGSDSGGACWAAVATAGSSGTFSIAPTHAGSTRYKLIAVYIFRGSAGIGNSNLYTGTAPAGCALTPTGADGAVAWLCLDWATAAVQSLSPAATSHGAASPGPTASPVAVQQSPSFTYYVACLDDQTSASPVSYGIGGSGTGPFTTIAIEAKAAGGSGPVSVNAGQASGTGTAPAPAASGATPAAYAGAAAAVAGSWATTGGAVGGTQGDYATWTDSAPGGSGTLELSAFGLQAQVPSGSAIGDVTAVIRHGETPAAAMASLTAQVYAGTTPKGSPVALTAGDAVHDDTVTFTGLALTWADLADLRVRLTFTRT